MQLFALAQKEQATMHPLVTQTYSYLCSSTHHMCGPAINWCLVQAETHPSTQRLLDGVQQLGVPDRKYMRG